MGSQLTGFFRLHLRLVSSLHTPSRSRGALLLTSLCWDLYPERLSAFFARPRGGTWMTPASKVTDEQFVKENEELVMRHSGNKQKWIHHLMDNMQCCRSWGPRLRTFGFILRSGCLERPLLNALLPSTPEKRHYMLYFVLTSFLLQFCCMHESWSGHTLVRCSHRSKMMMMMISFCVQV